MINDILVLRSLLPDPDILELDDVERVPGVTAFRRWLEGAAYQAEDVMRKWLNGQSLGNGQKEKSTELLLIKALLIEDHGFIDALSSSQIRAGGSQGLEVRFVRLPEEERGKAVSRLRDRAYELLTGKSADTFCGVV